MRDFLFSLPSFAAEDANIHSRLFKLIPVIQQKQFMYTYGCCWLLLIMDNILKWAAELRARLLMSHIKHQGVLDSTKFNHCVLIFLCIISNYISAFMYALKKENVTS